MKVAALFVCADAQLYSAVNSNRERLIPSALRKRWSEMVFSVIPLQLESGASEAQCVNAIENVADGFDGVLVLTPPHLAASLSRCREALFVFEYQPIGAPTNIQNQASGLLQRALTNFGYLLQLASQLKHRRALLLPLKDFSAPAIGELRNLFEDVAGNPQFIRTLERILADLRRYQVPKRVAKDEVHPVYIDEDEKAFDRGRESHAEAEIAIPPHDLMCGLNKTFRFGVAYDCRLHFNVTTKGDVRGHCFAGCHAPYGEKRVRRASHANLFPNGYVC